MNNEILNNIFSYITQEQNKKKSPILDVIDKKDYKLIVFKADGYEIRSFIEHTILTTPEQRNILLSNYQNFGYMTYNNKRRYTMIIFKEKLELVGNSSF